VIQDAAPIQSPDTEAQRLSEASEHLNEIGRESSDESDEENDVARQNDPSSISPYSTEPQSPTSEGLIRMCSCLVHLFQCIIVPVCRSITMLGFAVQNCSMSVAKCQFMYRYLCRI